MTKLEDLVGEWIGTKRLWLSPDAPARECETTAVVTLEARDRFATLRYTWTVEGEPQEGLLVVPLAAAPASSDSTDEPADADVAWVDSWHMGDKMMVCRREPDEGALVSARGSYAVPPGPDWGWRIALRADAPDQLSMVMHNITPKGEEARAVEATWTRRK